MLARLLPSRNIHLCGVPDPRECLGRRLGWVWEEVDLIQFLSLALQASCTVSGCSCIPCILLGHACNFYRAKTLSYILGDVSHIIIAFYRLRGYNIVRWCLRGHLRYSLFGVCEKWITLAFFAGYGISAWRGFTVTSESI